MAELILSWSPSAEREAMARIPNMIRIVAVDDPPLLRKEAIIRANGARCSSTKLGAV
jgi:hypothetical protein